MGNYRECIEGDWGRGLIDYGFSYGNGIFVFGGEGFVLFDGFEEENLLTVVP